MRCFSSPQRVSFFVACLWTAQVLGAASATNGPAFHSSLKAATTAAALDSSLVLLVFGAEWCRPCKELKQKTLDSPEFAQQAGLLQVAEVDIDTDAATARGFGIGSVPTLFLLTPESKIISRRTGFLHTAELLLWLREARDRVKQGKWEGTASGSKLDEFSAKAAADRLDTNDLARLVVLLGDPEPAERTAAGRLLLGQREAVVSPLIDALTNSYLGIRIGAAEVLRQLAPDAAAVNPWQSPGELAETVAGLRKWWATTGRLPPPAQSRQIDPSIAGSVRGALEALRGNDPVPRTEAMATLVTHGPTALPLIREAIKTAEKAGDQRSVTLLEDVRWAILVSDTVEQRAGNVRSVLARGKGSERQVAAARLARAGREAIPVLAELANDPDSLVVESAVRALSAIGGNDALPAMAALLKATDSNLRMTAAQALGHTKIPAAIKELLAVFDDPNEIVVSAALSALEEINASRSYSSSKVPQPPEVLNALKGCLADPRWRVRALAAEVVGKLKAKDLTREVKKLLDDPDGFVVKSTFAALCQLGAAPDAQKVMEVAKRHGSLRGDAVELLVKFGTDDAVKATIELYQSSPTDGRLAILRSLASGSFGTKTSADAPVWQPLFERAVREPEPRLRSASATALAAQPTRLAAALVGPLLSDEDTQTRQAAARAVLGIMSGQRVFLQDSHSRSGVQWLDDFEPPSTPSLPSILRSAQTNQPPFTTNQVSAWHNTLRPKPGTVLDLESAAAFFVTGQSHLDLPVLQAAFEKADAASLDAFSKTAGLAALLPRLPWPDGRAIAERLCGAPSAFLQALSLVTNTVSGLGEFLLEPARFRATVETASAETLESTLPRLLNPSQRQWSLMGSSPRVDGVIHALQQSTNAIWRAVAIFVMARRADSVEVATFEQASKDTNAWVRAIATQGLAKAAKDRPTLERLLAPLLADADKRVAQTAAIGLLEPETRSAAGWDYSLNYFEFEKIHTWASYSIQTSDQRPLTALESKPAFLADVRQRLAAADSDNLAAFALLLAQYGDFSGLDRVVGLATSDSNQENPLPTVALTGIALSRDSKYLPFLKQIAATVKEEQDLRKILQALKGMSGAESRELRLEVNRRLR